jgi:hypothetical protein
MFGRLISDAQQKVDREASCLAAFYRDVSNLPEPSRNQLQTRLATIHSDRNRCGLAAPTEGRRPEEPQQNGIGRLGNASFQF